MRRRGDGRQRRAAPEGPPIWWDAARPDPSPGPGTAAGLEEPGPLPPMSREQPSSQVDGPPPWPVGAPSPAHPSGAQPVAPPHSATTGQVAFEVSPPDATPGANSTPPITQLPRGHWLHDVAEPDGGEDVPQQIWVPDPPRPARPAWAANGSAQLVRPRPTRSRRPEVVRPADSHSSTGRPRANVERSLAASLPVDPAEAAQLATTFAMDYLSWDEDRPTRRAEVLRRYLPESADTTLGWSGQGRQRADFACAGQVVADGFVLWIDVRVRVTPYERTEPRSAPATPNDVLPDGGRWSAAPAPTAPGWRDCAAVWMRLTVPIRRHDCGDLVVDLSTIPDPDDAEGHVP
ncbi:hypothetical protein GCM10023403_47450 [Pseudonocardia benzenivorans]